MDRLKTWLCFGWLIYFFSFFRLLRGWGSTHSLYVSWAVCCFGWLRLAIFHDDVIKWKHLLRYWLFAREIHQSPVNSPCTGQWRGTWMFSLICARINGSVNIDEAGDLIIHRAYYGVIVISGIGNYYSDKFRGIPKVKLNGLFLLSNLNLRPASFCSFCADIKHIMPLIFHMYSLWIINWVTLVPRNAYINIYNRRMPVSKHCFHGDLFCPQMTQSVSLFSSLVINARFAT